jgi:hypothetical protein
MNNVIKMQYAGIYANEKFICIETSSGYRSGIADPKGKQHLLPPDADDTALGDALLDALAHSRFVLGERRTDVWVHPDAEYDMDLYDYQKNIERYAAWIENLKLRYSYKTKKALFRKMDNCGVEQVDGKIRISPMRHEKLEGWSGDGFTVADTVVISTNSSASEIGAAIHLALSRCTSAIA